MVMDPKINMITGNDFDVDAKKEEQANGDGNENSGPQAQAQAKEEAASSKPEPKTTSEDHISPKKKTNNNTSSRQDSDEDDAQAQQQDATFPQQLMDAIEGETNDPDAARVEGEKVMEWVMPDGESFVIRDKRALERDVLPKHFHARCKFMSFVRKLYRWGFRQVEKNLSGVMVFTHTNFVRGDRQRCLMMRSVVKKPAAHNKNKMPVPQTQAYNMGGPMDLTGNFPFRNMLQGGGFGGSGMGSGTGMGGQYGGMSGMGGMGGIQGFGSGRFNQFDSMGMGPQDGGLQQVRQVSVGHGQGQGNTDNFNGSSGMGRFGGGGMSSQFNPQGAGSAGGMGMGSTGGMTSRDMFEAGLRLERMEQRQRQMQMMESSFNGGGNGSSAMGMNNGMNNNRPSPPLMGNSSPNMGGGGGGTNFGGRGGTGGADVSQVELASQLMKQDPSMEPWKALELAKRTSQQ